jgi:Camelysin metallo-endopeptidase
MTVRPKLIMGLGIAIAGLGLIGAGAGATFTAQVSASSEISSGGLELSLNDKTGTDVNLELDGKHLGSHFTPISQDLVLKNTGTLDMASTFLKVSATGCEGGRGSKGSALARSLHVRLTELSRDRAEHSNERTVIFDGALCSLANDKTITSDLDSQGFSSPPTHENVGGQLPDRLLKGDSAEYRLVIQPDDTTEGLPSAAQRTSTKVHLTFSGFDY